MAPLRTQVLRSTAVLFAIVLAVGVALSAFTGGWESLAQPGWAVAMAAGIAAFSGWQATQRVKKGLAGGILTDFRLVALDRDEWPEADWRAIDDLCVPLEARGYVRLGDFTSNAPQTAARGFARFLADPEGTRLVEIQHFERRAATPEVMGDEHFRLRISLLSVVGGRIRVTVTDRPAHPSFWVMRSEEAVVATYPGASLLELVEKHRRLVGFVAQKTGKTVDAGLTLARYVALEREKFAAVKRGLEGRSGWALMGEWDGFVASPRSQWSAGEARLRELPARPLSDLDAPDAVAEAGAPPAGEAGDPALRERMRSGAHWFYWIAGLSLVNAVTAAMGSDWGFVIGLGLTQVVSAIAAAASEGGDAPAALTATALAIDFAVIGAFFLVGWLATRPSVAAFAIGITVFALDTLIFLVAGDWVGVAFHALALYFLWRGMQAAREMKRSPAAAD
jgi:hypothetical protein